MSSPRRRLLLACLPALLAGCPHWEPAVDAGPRPTPNGDPDPPVKSFLSTDADKNVDFKGTVSCPPPFAPCTYRWEFGDGRTSTLKDPGPIAFDKVGYYPVTFTAVSADGTPDSTPGQAAISVWDGTFKDSFDRSALDWDRFGWRHPILQDTAPYQDIDDGALRIRGAYHLPGSTAILAYPLVGNCHIEVTKRRHPDPTTTHFSDVIVRFHPTKRNGSFIRIRIQEERAIYDSPVEVGVFKISRPDDEHGCLINDSLLHHELCHIDCIPAPQYGTCATYAEFTDRTDDIRIFIDVLGPKISVRLARSSKPTEQLQTVGATDDIGEPYLYEGSVGLAQYEDTTHFDDFVLERKP